MGKPTDDNARPARTPRPSRAGLAGRLVVIAVALAAYFVRLPADWVERVYSRGIYARLQPIVTGVSNRVPFALFDVLLVAASTVVLITTVTAVARAWREGAMVAVRFAVTLTAAAAVVYLVFLGMWGLNYQREPIAKKLAFTRQAAGHDALVRLAGEVVDQLNLLHDRAHKEGFPSWDEVRPAMDQAFQGIQARFEPGVRPRAGVPKWSLLSYYFDRSGVSGMTDPFFLEVLVDREMLPIERPFVVAHEWAHLAGYADEAEANFLAWLTCVNGRAPAAYSGWLFLYSEALAALPRAERAPYVRALGAGPRADLTALAERARRIHPILRRVSWRVYDQYLKGNRVAEGVASYDRALQLVLGTRFVDGWTPVLAGER